MAKVPLRVVPSDPTSRLVDQLSFLKKLSVFQGVSEETILRLVRAGEDRSIAKGDYVFKEYELGSTLVFFYQGLAVESKRCGETDCVLAYYSEPSIIGESSFMDSCPRSTSLFANEDSRVGEIHNAELRKLASESPVQFEKLYTNLGRELGKKVSYVNLKMTQANQNSFGRESGISWYSY